MDKDWDPQHYQRYEKERNRPPAELLARIAHIKARRITDLGCGAGSSTALLRQAWPQAEITGVDSSPAMLAAARAKLPDCRFVQQDFHDWQPEMPQDIVFANASLQWSATPQTLLPHLIRQLEQGGVLAAQMPDNLDEPSHLLMRETAALPKWKHLTQAAESRPPVWNVRRYYDLLTAQGCRVDVWRTVYYHVLPDTAAIADMFAATALRPYLACLDKTQQEEFMRAYVAQLNQYYPRQQDGNVLLALPRMFIVAHKGQAV